jgi:transposase
VGDEAREAQAETGARAGDSEPLCVGPIPEVETKELEALLRERMAEGRADEVVGLVVEALAKLNQSWVGRLLQVLRQQRARYARRSEKLDAHQLELLDRAIDRLSEHHDETPDVDYEVDESQPADPEHVSPKREKARRRRVLQQLPAGVPRETVEIAVAEGERACPECGQERGVIGYERRGLLELEPPRFRVLEYAREKRACARCKSGVVTAPAAPVVTERGLYGAGLISHVVVSKYDDHLPLYRQARQFKREGVVIPRSTLGDLVAEAAHELQPVAEAIRAQILAADIVQTDDTGLRVLRRGPADEKDRLRGHYWPYRAENWVYVDYTPTRAGAGPQAWLESFRGYVQVDDFAGYRRLFGEDSGRIEVGCMAHARRYFHWAEEQGERRALEMLGHIATLYRIEAQASEQGLDPPQRKALRAQLALPVLDAMQAWLEQHAAVVPPKSEFGRAIRYMRRRMSALRRYLDDGRLEIDNNAVERLIRGIALGRRNYLFAGSDAGARRAAVLYSVIWTARMHGLDARLYIRDLLERIAAGWPQRELRALLPDAWLAAHPAAPRSTPPA